MGASETKGYLRSTKNYRKNKCGRGKKIFEIKNVGEEGADGQREKREKEDVESEQAEVVGLTIS